jgi:hypothetical protein
MANQHIPVTGGCLCGAIRYESKEPPTQGFYCHCTLCQKSLGGLFGASLSFPGSAFKFTKGEPKYYHATSFAKRGFCVDCGSPLAFFYEGISNVWIWIGCLDRPEDWPMTRDASWGHSVHWHTDTKVPWYEINDGLPQPTNVPAEEHVARTSKAAT